MKPKEKTCQNCRTSFTIDASDFEFYQKISVPEPTFCPECRNQRRLSFQNERNIYKRKCDFSGKEIFSVFSPKAPIKVYDQKIWYSDQWDPLEYGRDYDFSKPFFQQLKKLSREVPWLSRVLKDDVVNSDYSILGSDLKNCYLLFFAGHCESCAYGNGIDRSKDCYDNYHLRKCELCYECFMLNSCYKAFYSSHGEDCQEIYYCQNCIDCSWCFGCINLRHKKYHIFNQPYPKEEYERKLKEFNMGSYQSNLNFLRQSREYFLKYPVKFIHGRKNVDVVGDYLDNCKDVRDSYLVKKGENLRYCDLIWDTTKDCYDYYCWGENASLVYETVLSGLGLDRMKFCFNCWPNCRELEYCMSCHSCSSLFGCVGLRHKQYCILNKQYTKEQYEELVPKIREHMEKVPYLDSQKRVYQYGDFFPSELSPYAYNETMAQEYFPLNREGALAKGFNWYDKPEAEYMPTLKVDNLPDHVAGIDRGILKDIVECQNKEDGSCSGSGVFRIVPQEYEFLKRQNISFPRLCPVCRHLRRIERRNPFRLHRRQCQCAGHQSVNGVYQNQSEHFHKDKPCPNEFETTYAPDRPEIVYCEACYNKEVE